MGVAEQIGFVQLHSYTEILVWNKIWQLTKLMVCRQILIRQHLILALNF